MISKYDEFLLERDMQLLLEATIIFDNKFDSLLNKIESPIADELKKISGIEVDTNYNYITYDVDKEDKVFFIPDDKAKKVEDPETLKKSDMNVGRFVRAILTKAGVNVDPKELESFVSKYKSEILVEKEAFSRFEIVDGENIRYWYLTDNYYTSAGILGSSCMRYAHCQNYLSIYCENPDRVSLIILKSSDDPEKISGRALLWLDDQGRKFMDRVYIINSGDTESFIKFAKENGFYYKKHQTYETGDPIMFNGKELEPDDSWVTVTLKYANFDDYPYMDTLKYLIKDENKITSNFLSNYDAELTSTSGGDGSCTNCGGHGDVECSDCEGSGKTECYPCEGSGTIDCRNCDGDGTEECSDCEGSGKTECGTCDGDGTDDEGEKCSDCDGSGTIDCENCEGDGTEKCSNCDGDGTQECSRCDGDGVEECEACDGYGRVSCYDCN